MEIAVIILLIVCAALMVICYIECVIADRPQKKLAEILAPYTTREELIIADAEGKGYAEGFKDGLEAGRPQGDSVSRRYLLAEIDDLADEFSGVDENGLHSERWCGILDSRVIIMDAPSVLDRPQGWIPCSERLPEEGETVLATFQFQDGRGCMTSERITLNGGEIWSAAYGKKPLAWMPLPKPWKGADDE